MDDFFKFNSLVLSMYHLNQSHSGEYLFECLLTVIKKWQLESKVNQFVNLLNNIKETDLKTFKI